MSRDSATGSATAVRVTKAERRNQWDAIREAFGYRCAYCGKKPDLLFREHTIPKARGGDDSLENIVPACSGCNTRKGQLTPLEWFLGISQPKRPRRVWPAANEPCRRCGGPCTRRRYGKTGNFYNRCSRCRYEMVAENRAFALISSPLDREGINA